MEKNSLFLKCKLFKVQDLTVTIFIKRAFLGKTNANVKQLCHKFVTSSYKIGFQSSIANKKIPSKSCFPVNNTNISKNCKECLWQEKGWEVIKQYQHAFLKKLLQCWKGETGNVTYTLRYKFVHHCVYKIFCFSRNVIYILRFNAC